MDPVLVDLIYVKIYWYSVIILLAFLLAGYVAMKEAKKFDIDEDTFINFVFFLVPISLLGARIYYVIFNWSHYSDNLLNAFRVWEGGLAIHGGIIFGLLWIILFVRMQRINFMRFLDIVAPALLLGQAIGRWGNFMNQEAYGPATTAAHLESLYIPKFIIEGMYINGVYYHPTFFYEFVWCLIGFFLLLLIRKISQYLKIGQLTGLGLIWLGAGRYYIEGMRLDSLMIGDIKVAQVVSILMILIGIFLYFKARRRSHFQNLYHDKDPGSFKIDADVKPKEINIERKEKVIDDEFIDKGFKDEV